MAKLRDWVDLGRNTFDGLSADELASLYSVEWPETKKMLISDHRLAIEQEPSALRRGLQTVSA
ncbi:MAG TPA: hypothetical protein VF057_06810, partial [Thermoanaerobaculia bacterium]